MAVSLTSTITLFSLFSFHPTAPRPPLLQQDVFYSLNQSLTFLDKHNAIACEARGIWFQIGFQSSFFFTACTAYELYNMITTTMKDSSFAVGNLHGSHSGRGSTNCCSSLTRFQQYVIVFFQKWCWFLHLEALGRIWYTWF